jgi:hypothetical protein
MESTKAKEGIGGGGGTTSTSTTGESTNSSKPIPSVGNIISNLFEQALVEKFYNAPDRYNSYTYPTGAAGQRTINHNTPLVLNLRGT